MSSSLCCKNIPDIIDCNLKKSYPISVERSFDGQLCQEYLFQKSLKSDNFSSSYNRKCRGCFWDTV